MFKVKPIVQGLALAFGGLASAAMLVGPAVAQTPAPAPAQTQVKERVEITGSAIKRIEGEGALPVTVITRQEIDQLGVLNAAELINVLSSNNGGGYQLSNALGDAARPGFSGASLRGLGSNSTLVLLNGRRLAAYAYDGGGVNLNQIPFAAIERIEVLRDGASSIYGSDAVAGVINFITRKDYEGLQAKIGGSWPTGQGGGEAYGVTLTAGIGDLAKDRYNVFGVFSYVDQNSLMSKDRPYAKTALRRDIPMDPNITGFPFVQRLSSNAYPGNILTPAGAFRNPYAPAFAGAVPGVTTDPYNGIYPSAGCDVPASYDLTSSGTRCRYDYASQIDIVPDNEVFQFLGRGVFQLNANTQLFSEFSYSKQKSTFRISQTPASEATTAFNPALGLFNAPLLYPAGGPFYPGNGIVPAIPGTPLTGDLNLYYRTLELGPRTNEVTTDEWRFLLGAEGVVAGWDYNAAVYYTSSKASEQYLGGYVLESRLLPAMYTGTINPFGRNTGAGLALLQSTQIKGDVRTAELTQWAFDGKIAKDITNLPAGPLGLALGLQYYNQDYKDTPSPILGNADIIGGAGEQPPVNGSRNWYGIFAEFNIPVIKNLEAQLAVRYDHYSDFGGNTSPKAALKWTPTKELLFRASFGQGFRAPTLPDIVSPPARTNSGGVYDDPFYNTGAAVGAVPGCIANFTPVYCGAQLSVTNSGNKNLQPEKSDQWSFGFVYEPTNNVSVGVDFWYINQTDLIGFPGGDNILTACIDNYDAATNTCSGALTQYIRYKTVLVNGVPIKVIDTAFNQIGNLAAQDTRGIDIAMTFRLPRTEIGNWTLQFNGTYLPKQAFKYTNIPDQDWQNFAGEYLLFGPIARFKGLTQLTWQSGPWSTTFSAFVQSGYNDQYTNPDGTPHEVGTYGTYDWYLQWTGIKNLTIAGGIKNLTQRTPPKTNQNSYFQVGFDPTYVNPIGRAPYLSVEYKFF